ncbi:hypothetical protein Golax_001398 [Gossypium laxum]|uniref:Uncharacterized protein n=1 Tax=Gossypium laxum TaxID=34288 RepID=A0A7J9AX15_9ROSI|nr:hypothetical protein [Gossypium laxum]
MFSLWKKLEALCMIKSLANKLVLKQRLYMFRMAEGESIRAHISEFVTLVNDIKNLEDVKGNLLSKDKLNNELGPNKRSDGQGSVLVARGKQESKKPDRNKSRARSKSKNHEKECDYCKKKGHIKLKC